MAKSATNAKEKAPTKEKSAPKEKAPAKEKPEYGIGYLSEKLGREPHLVRVSLRRLKIDKNGGRYAWDNKADADEIVAQLKKSEPADASEKKADKKAPAKADKKAPAKKVA